MGKAVWHDLKNLRNLMRALVKGAESGECTVERLLDGSIEPSSLDTRQLKRLRRYQLILERKGKLGARLLEIALTTRGCATVRIDGGEWIRLTPRQAQLVLAIAGDGKVGTDGLPAWTPTAEVARKMEQISGTRVAPSSLANLCLRVRDELIKHMENPYFLQTREGAIRFAAREVVWTSEKVAQIPGPQPPAERA